MRVLQIWPLAGMVAQGRNADCLVHSISGKEQTMSLQRVRVFVDHARAFDICHVSLSPAACSNLLSSCRDSLQHLTLSFAPHMALTGLSDNSFYVASRLKSLELIISLQTKAWCCKFISKGMSLERLVLSLPSDGCPELTTELLEKSCPRLRHLVVTSGGGTPMAGQKLAFRCSHNVSMLIQRNGRGLENSRRSQNSHFGVFFGLESGINRKEPSRCS